MLRKKITHFSPGARMLFCVFVCWLFMLSIVPTLQGIEAKVEQVNVSLFALSSVIFVHVVFCDSGKRVVGFAFVSDQLGWKRICMRKELARLILGKRHECGSESNARTGRPLLQVR